MNVPLNTISSHLRLIFLRTGYGIHLFAQLRLLFACVSAKERFIEYNAFSRCEPHEQIGFGEKWRNEKQHNWSIVTRLHVHFVYVKCFQKLSCRLY